MKETLKQVHIPSFSKQWIKKKDNIFDKQFLKNVKK